MPQLIKMRTAPVAFLLLFIAAVVGGGKAAANEADGCACLWNGSFTEVAPNTDLVVVAKVKQQKCNSIDIEVAQSLKGQAYLEQVRVWLQAKNYCRPKVDEFPIETTWMFALSRIRAVPEGGFDPGTPNVSFGRVDDYELSSCGGYWLKYDSGVVTGNLVDAPRWAREPDMTPVLVDVVDSFLKGKTSREAVLEASKRDPQVRELMLDTKAFLRGDLPANEN
ncbi:MAG: delta-aminolevulinic acid dehydratase [Pseudomonadota bacterium]